jgi:thiamine biosynthesis protein ThiS
MRLRLNGRDAEAPDGSTLDALLEGLRLAPGRIAVERNGQVVPRDRYADVRLEDGDVIEVVQLVGGG